MEHQHSPVMATGTGQGDTLCGIGYEVAKDIISNSDFTEYFIVCCSKL